MPDRPQCIVVLNAGSSSIKFAIHQAGPSPALLFRGQIEGIGTSPRLAVFNGTGEQLAESSWAPDMLDHAAATRVIVDKTRELAGRTNILAVGHRVVHGGTRFCGPVRVDPDVLAELAELAALAPLHQPHNLAPIKAIAENAPDITQVACFDTAFHRSQPPIAQIFGLPRQFTDMGIRRYGFHGLSYEYVTARLREVAPALSSARLVIAHLGSGASLCAVRDGKSVATTMGFTALDGLLMGTRCGSLDPGVLIHLIKTYDLTAGDLEDLLYRKSGLLGVSGISADMRVLRASHSETAALAIQLFVYRVLGEIGLLASALGGLDGLVFTGGIGEHDAATRAEIIGGCEWMGFQLDRSRNSIGEGLISSARSRYPAWVIPTDEERMIAIHTAAMLRTGRPQLRESNRQGF